MSNRDFEETVQAIIAFCFVAFWVGVTIIGVHFAIKFW